jgi:two-component system phosphate regulon sensor histidine kinase PhoR
MRGARDGREDSRRGLPIPEWMRSGGVSLERLLESLPDGIALVDRGGDILWSNRRFRELLELEAGGAGRCVSVIAGPYAEELEGLRLLEAVRAGEGEIEVDAFTRRGVSFPCLVRITAVPNADEARLLTVVDQRETAQLRAEMMVRAELAQRERGLLRATADAVDEGVMLVDDSERVVVINRAASGLFGLAPERAQGSALVELPLPGQVRGAWLAFVASDERSSAQTVELERDGETRTLLLRFFRTIGQRGATLGSLLSVRDLTGSTDLDRRCADFFRSVGRELRAPLQSVRGAGAVLSGQQELSPEARDELLATLQENAARLGDVLETLLEQVGLGAEAQLRERNETDLREVLTEAVAAARVAHGLDESQVRLDLPAEPVTAIVDRPRLRRAFEQILGNAAVHGASPRGVRTYLRRVGNEARVQVRDWGCGVSPEHLERIFDPIYRLTTGPEAWREGGELGLPMSRQVLEQHGGAISAEIPQGGGLRVKIRLPCRDAD